MGQDNVTNSLESRLTVCSGKGSRTRSELVVTLHAKHEPRLRLHRRGAREPLITHHLDGSHLKANDIKSIQRQVTGEIATITKYYNRLKFSILYK